MSNHQESQDASEALIVRLATLEDLDAIVWIVQHGHADDPGCDYKFPYRSEHLDDFLKWTKQEYTEYLAQQEKFILLVVTAAVVEADAATRKAVALALWDVATDAIPIGGGKSQTRC